MSAKMSRAVGMPYIHYSIDTWLPPLPELSTNMNCLRHVATLLSEIYLQLIPDRKSTRLNSSHQIISYAVFCLKKKALHCAPCGSNCGYRKRNHCRCQRSRRSNDEAPHLPAFIRVAVLQFGTGKGSGRERERV